MYGLRLSRKVFGQMLQECLLDLGFVLFLVESSIYMRKCPTADHYEYIATYLDDLTMTLKDPKAFIAQLESTLYNFKLKGFGPLNFHLGRGFKRNSTGTLCMDPGKYKDQREDAYVYY